MSFSNLILDTETHRLNGLPIEIAYAPIQLDQRGLTVNESLIYDEYFSLDQDTEIQLSSMAIHHILPQDLIGKPNFHEFRLPQDTIYLIGHNIDYDIQAIARCGQDVRHIKPICTLALARYVWPNLDSHSLSTLSYVISDNLEQTRQQLKNAHNAKTDILLTANLLDKIIQHYQITDIEQLYQQSQQARLPQFMPFGKYKGTPLAQVPIDYVQWLLRQSDIDPYLREALEQCF
ncbi:putative quorum-sensing-regulated virulence factor [Acinetobacter puyangensis]|uniref:putative quorum-sensing-regulated virulence factor n=1 Tax=Acinetobacter puyangensis TaxID=1096779 RepID=UPI003A4D4BA9